MANTKSAKKAVRQSLRKRNHNTLWKNRIKAVVKTIRNTIKTDGTNADILKKEESTLQKTLDKAAKNNVIHKNKASRLKSRYAKRISAQSQSATSKAKTKSKK